MTRADRDDARLRPDDTVIRRADEHPKPTDDGADVHDLGRGPDETGLRSRISPTEDVSPVS